MIKMYDLWQREDIFYEDEVEKAKYYFSIESDCKTLEEVCELANQQHREQEGDLGERYIIRERKGV